MMRTRTSRSGSSPAETARRNDLGTISRKNLKTVIPDGPKGLRHSHISARPRASLLPLREKVASEGGRMRGLAELSAASGGRGGDVGATPHPTPFHGATFSRRGRRVLVPDLGCVNPIARRGDLRPVHLMRGIAHDSGSRLSGPLTRACGRDDGAYFPLWSPNRRDVSPDQPCGPPRMAKYGCPVAPIDRSSPACPTRPA